VFRLTYYGGVCHEIRKEVILQSWVCVIEYRSPHTCI
jgi:hypothetical protein